MGALSDWGDRLADGRAVVSGEEPPTKKVAKKVVAGEKESGHVVASRAVQSSLAMEEAKRKAGMSDAVKSLYGDKNKKSNQTWATMGTFTRVRNSNSILALGISTDLRCSMRE